MMKFWAWVLSPRKEFLITSFGKNGMILSIPDAVAQILDEHVRAPQEKLALEFPDSDLSPSSGEGAGGGATETAQALEAHNRTVLDAMTATVAVRTGGDASNTAASPAPHVQSEKRAIANIGWAPECPTCGSMLAFQEGCMTCRGCGYSKCT